MSKPDPIAEAGDEAVAGAISRLAELDGPADESEDWPLELWAVLDEIGAPRWSMPRSFGGEELGRPTLVRRNVLLAEGSLTAAFILTQHDAAVRRLVGASNAGSGVAADWLGRIGRGEAFATVSLSQLTTSRRRGTRALEARELPGGGVRLDGRMPWVTAAARADLLVAGAVLEDDRQVLVAVPTGRGGLSVDPPTPIAALQASWTTEVVCDGVEIRPEEILFGPAADVLSMSTGGGGTAGLETSSLALGQSRAAVREMRGLLPDRQDLEEPLEAIDLACRSLANELISAAEGRADASPAGEIRQRANALVLNSTQALLTARKGSGFLRPDPAQRFARQALFFLVWSCPSPVARAALMDFAGICAV